MKKNRPGLLVTMLSEPDNVSRLIDLIFRETTTIGVRAYDVRRKTLARESVIVETRVRRNTHENFAHERFSPQCHARV